MEDNIPDVPMAIREAVLWIVRCPMDDCHRELLVADQHRTGWEAEDFLNEPIGYCTSCRLEFRITR